VTRDRPKNVGASARARLRNHAREHHLEFQLVLTEYAVERFLHRLGASSYADQFVLKGAMLFRLWSEEHRRATWDLDLLGPTGTDAALIASIISEICSIQADDGLEFETAGLRSERIRLDDEAAGLRYRLHARLADARIPMQIDIGFGDVPVPAPQLKPYPTLLDHPPPKVLTYARESVVAEKLEAMITLGVTNSRMKDFYDVGVLASTFAFEGEILATAIRSTFARRQTPVPTVEPVVLSREFLQAPERRTQWRAFIRRSRLSEPVDFERLEALLRDFLLPILTTLANDREFNGTWRPCGPWRVQP